MAYRYRQLARAKKRRRIRRLFPVLLLLFFLIRGFEHQVGVFTERYFPQFARQVTADCVSEAVEQVLRQGNYTYQSFASVKYSDGSPCAVQTNAAVINTFKNSVVKTAEAKLKQIHNSSMHIPLGAFTGLTLLSNHGPKIPLSYCLTGSFSAELVSSFDSSGINQTIHHIQLVVTAHIVTASVDYRDTLTFSTDFEIAQSVLMGTVPSVYGGTCSVRR